MSTAAEIVVLADEDRSPADYVSLLQRMHETEVARLATFKAVDFPNCLIYVIDAGLREQATRKTLDALLDDPVFSQRPRIFILNTLNRRDLGTVYSFGAADYLIRPVANDLLSRTLDKAISHQVEHNWTGLNKVQQSALKVSLRSFEDFFSCAGKGLELPIDDVKAACDLLIEATRNSGIETLMDAVRSHHNYTFRHSMLVCGNLIALGEGLGVGNSDLQKLACGGLLHDVGKAFISTELLDKPGELDPDEWKVMQAHAGKSREALEGIPGLESDIVVMAGAHHERLDGSGYPKGLKGAEIDDLTRLAAIVDVYSSLIDKRTYKPALSKHQALATMASMGAALDQDLLKAFRAIVLHAQDG